MPRTTTTKTTTTTTKTTITTTRNWGNGHAHGTVKTTNTWTKRSTKK